MNELTFKNYSKLVISLNKPVTFISNIEMLGKLIWWLLWCPLFYDGYYVDWPNILQMCYYWCVYKSQLSLIFYFLFPDRLRLEPASFRLNFLIKINNSLKFLHLNLILPQLRRKLKNNRKEHNKHPNKLYGSGRMLIIQNTNKNSQYFASSNHKGYDMLFELFNHTVHEELAKAT